MSDPASQPSATSPTPGAEPAAAPAAEGSLLTGAPPATPPADPAAPAAPAVPEKYEFTAPEGADGKPLALDPEKVTAFEGVARDAKLTQDQYAAVMAHGSKMLSEAAAAPVEAWKATQAEWKAAINADPEIGGDKLPAALGDAARALDAFGGQSLREALVITGAGNNPAIVRAFVAIGRAMGEANGLLTGKPAGAAKALSAEQAARNIYNQGGGSYPDLPA